MKLLRQMYITSLVLFLAGCHEELYSGLPEEEANQMLAILMAHRIDADKKQDEGGTTLRVEKSQFINAVEVLRLSGFPHRQYTTAESMFPANQIVVSPQEEQQKIGFLKEQKMEGMLSQVDGVVNASVTVALPSADDESTAFPGSVAVFIKYSPQVNLEAIRIKIVDLIEKSIPGLQYGQISILMQPAEFRAIGDAPESKPFRTEVSIAAMTEKVIQWLTSRPWHIAAVMVGTVASLALLLRYLWLMRRP